MTTTRTGWRARSCTPGKTAHLTLTGAYAGQPICGKAGTEEEGGVHYAWLSDAQIAAYLTDPDACPDCVKAWQDTDASDDA